MEYDVAIIGGGAAGYFAAITCGESNPGLKVALLEATARPLTKVKISGGGRCNVTHNCMDPILLCKNYPRGHKELRQVFHKFHVVDTIEWFKRRGVTLRAEADGRMFATTNKSQTIIDCLNNAAAKAKVDLLKTHLVKSVAENDGQFTIFLANKPPISCKKVLLASGSAPIGHKIASTMGHKVIPIVPSLFTFTIEDSRIDGIAGLSIEQVSAKLSFSNSKKKYTQTGPLLVTHWGLSGPCILKLSAWAARELAEHQYQAKLELNLLPDLTREQISATLLDLKTSQSKKNIYKCLPFPKIPKRMWAKLLEHLEIPADLSCAHLSNKHIEAFLTLLQRCTFQVSAKGEYKDEFVSCGGVSLKEVDTKTMESKLVKGLFFAGEILNIDGVTGGFNFQNAWSTAWIAGNNMKSSE
ncbi:MAG: NAD(P)/FAD-dependent oxidoreductase [Oligoflexales bacterium]|nr:NAD(P)/FAD-dependent oxidoreductase [Oligoflexales bacterium]